MPLGRAGRAGPAVLPHLFVWQKEQKASSRCRVCTYRWLCMLKQSEMKDCSSLVPDLLPYDALLFASALSECHGLTPYCALMYHQLVLKLVCHIIRTIPALWKRNGWNLTYLRHTVLTGNIPMDRLRPNNLSACLADFTLHQRITLRWREQAKLRRMD